MGTSSPLELWQQAGRLHRHCPIFTAAVWLASPTDSCLCEAVCTPQPQQDGAEGPQDGQAHPKARRAPSLPPCRAARLASIERAPPPRAVDQSGLCPRPLTFQRVSWAALHASDLARRRRGAVRRSRACVRGELNSHSGMPPHHLRSVDQQGMFARYKPSKDRAPKQCGTFSAISNTKSQLAPQPLM